jgi:site-specific DNA-methyltransferase (adenine-specific)
VTTYNPQKTERTDAELLRLAKEIKVSASKTQHASHLQLWNVNRDNGKLKHPNTVIRINAVMGSSHEKQQNAHPTQKPLALLEYLVKTYTNEGDTVLDFTMGSGTTGHACGNLGRRFVGIEKDAGYFDIAQERIATAYAPLRLMQGAV